MKRKKLNKKQISSIKSLMKKYGVSKHEAAQMYVRRGF